MVKIHYAASASLVTYSPNLNISSPQRALIWCFTVVVRKIICQYKFSHKAITTLKPGDWKCHCTLITMQEVIARIGKEIYDLKIKLITITPSAA